MIIYKTIACFVFPGENVTLIYVLSKLLLLVEEKGHRISSFKQFAEVLRYLLINDMYEGSFEL